MIGKRGKGGLERLKAFSDGVFAIVLTLLVIDLELPDDSVSSVGAFLMSMEPQLRPYIASFAFITAFWVTQGVILGYIERTDRRFLWLNVCFFLPVSLVPFITSLRSSYVGDPVFAQVYGLVLVLAFLILLRVWRYAVSRLRDEPLDRKIVHSLDLRIWAAIGLCVLGSILAPFSERVATLAFVAVPLLFFSHSKLDHGAAS